MKGDRFGDAVKKARTETYNLHKDRTNTWGAYQCYGDPSYRLVVKTAGGQGWQEKFVDIDEAIVKINQQYEIAKTASAQGIEKIKSDLKNLRDGIEKDHPAWLQDARLLEALGEAFSEAFWFEEAVKYLDPAISNRKSTTSIRAIEMSANCHIRLAVQMVENNPKKYGEAKRSIEKQIKLLNQLMDTIGETSERLSLIGSGYKRLAGIASTRNSNVCDKALKDMDEFYSRARKVKVREGAYPLTNALTARILQMLRTSDLDRSKLPEIKELKVEAENLAEKDALNSLDDFWAKIGVTDAKLLNYLYKYLNSKKEVFSNKIHIELVEDYRNAWRQYGSARQLNSIIDHYSFLVAVLEKFEAHENLHNALEKILNSLNSMVEDEV